MIYAHLLCSQVLSQALSVRESYEVGQLWDSQKYGLSPQILRTCRQIYVEASVVLYGWNTYIVDFRYTLITPILRTRNFGGIDLRPPYATKKFRCMVIANLDIPVLKKVRRWKIVPLAGHARPYGHIPCRLALFCHQITSSPPTSIEVNLDLRCVVKEKDLKYFQAFEDEVRHLGLLRKVGRFKVDSMPVEDVGSPCYDEAIDVAWEMEDDLKALIEGDSPVDSLHQMYQNLKVYCDALGYDASRLIYPWDSGVLGCNNTLFKDCRRRILQRLEPQYQRVMAASLALIDFIESEKHDQGMFTRPARESNCKFGEAFTLAEDFTTSFLPEPSWKERVSDWETRCSNAEDAQKHPCHVQLEQARKFVAWGGITNGLSSFRAAVNELDTKCLDLRKSRMGLFEFDGLKEPKCGNFDIEAWRCDEKINWESYEPQMIPKRNPAFSILHQDTAAVWYA